MSLLTQFLSAGGGGNGATGATPHLLPITTSTTWTAPKAGVVITRQMGAGGGGSGDSSGSGCGTGGGSAAWGEKRWSVTAGQEFVIAIGAAGLGGTNAPGSDGGATTITSNGITVTTPGGKGGLYSATPAALTSPGGAAPTNADFGAAGVKSGNTAAFAAAYTGGAGVNLYAQPGSPTRSGDALNSNTGTGGGSTTYPSADVSASASQSAGAGFLGPSVGATPGPGLFSTAAPTSTTDLYATQGPWGVWPTGPGNASFQSAHGGGGESGASVGRPGGAFSGGGACRSTGASGNGGFGGGGGAGRTKGGDGGQGYAVIEFIPAE